MIFNIQLYKVEKYCKCHLHNHIAKRNQSNESKLQMQNKEKIIKDVIEGIVFNKQSVKPHINPKKVVLDFSSPNIAKPFHMGHLRSTIIGNFIANINTYFQNDVTRINYLGDWGTQFGFLQYGLRANGIKIDDLKTDPIKKLFECYVYANNLSMSDENVHKEAVKYFSDVEHGKVDLGEWKSIRVITKIELNKIYKRLGIQFDEYQWESDYNGKAIKNLLDLLESKNIVSIDETGKTVANINNKLVTVLKSDKSTLYLTRDIAALLDRFEKYHFDEMLYIVDNGQHHHFASVFEMAKQIDSTCAARCKHIKFGRIKGMSTRKGNVVFLNDILDEAKHKVYEQQKVSKNTRTSALNEDTCEILGTSALFVSDLKQKRTQDYEFDWNRALQTDGDSGIKLQYIHCRLYSLEKNCGVALPNFCDPYYLKENIIETVVLNLMRFDSVLNKSLMEHEAHFLVMYLFQLSKSVNRMFNELNVKNVEKDLAAQRLLVFHSARIIIKKALEILGIRPLNEM